MGDDGVTKVRMTSDANVAARRVDKLLDLLKCDCASSSKQAGLRFTGAINAYTFELT